MAHQLKLQKCVNSAAFILERDDLIGVTITGVISQVTLPQSSALATRRSIQ